MATSAAAKALKAEAEKPEFRVVEFRGDLYKVPGDPEDWDIEVIESYEDQNIVSAVRALLGAEQWALMKSRNKLKTKDILEIADALFETIDANVGK